jgi:hypothetical protein
MNKLLTSIIVVAGVAAAAHAQTAVEHVTAPGGKVVYYIMSLPGRIEDPLGGWATGVGPKQAIAAGRNRRILLTSTPSISPEKNLTDFSHLFLSPDGNTLYFHTSAWATSAAIHSLDIATGKTAFVTSGGISCIVSGGEYQGDLVVEQHRYFIQGGSYDALYLFTPAGKQIGIVSQNADASQVCTPSSEMIK